MTTDSTNNTANDITSSLQSQVETKQSSFLLNSTETYPAPYRTNANAISCRKHFLRVFNVVWSQKGIKKRMIEWRERIEKEYTCTNFSYKYVTASKTHGLMANHNNYQIAHTHVRFLASHRHKPQHSWTPVYNHTQQTLRMRTVRLLFMFLSNN